MTSTDNQPAQLRSLAETLAAEAAAFVRRRRGEVFGAGAPDAGDAPVRTKSTPTDPVTVVDTETERLLRDRLAQLRSADLILGEEGADQPIPPPPLTALSGGCSIPSTAR
ncbi:inositol monophosphatase family protein [Mycobacterium xenopi 4042]|uniref:Inositol monophosphatase family protein n=1 Tax=Mycobacterium xenopi 4042 TaxID=1299334 RepID=X8CH57_MYCXE|nr:inositol monophosphatase family protein [Mycobacterium xenopi 3993]EUA54620.1 inositol monophosphatase family protein [Mycobacterium xenopi 4042]